MKIGVLAVQGGFREHAVMLRSLGAEVAEVRLPEQLAGLDGLVIPGGESTAIGRLIRLYGLEEPLARFPGPVFGTCAGMILLARSAVDGAPGQVHFGLIDAVVRRNAFGRQVGSHEVDLKLNDEEDPVRGVFIRAPWIEQAGPGVEVLAEAGGHPVLAREGRILVAAFHPELTSDTRIHELFIHMMV